MSVSLAEIRRWRGDVVAQCARSVTANRGRLEALALLGDQGPRAGGAWDGEAALEAEAQHTRVVREHRRLVAAVAASAAALDRAAEQVAAVVRLLEAAEGSALQHGLTITDMGHVVDVPGWSVPADPVTAQVVSLAQERARWELRDDVEQLLARANEVDATLRSALVAAAEERSTWSIGGTVSDIWAAGNAAVGWPPSIPQGFGGATWTPWDSAAWWALLAAPERERLIADHPDLVGPANGLPAWARDRANRVLLQRAEDWLVWDQDRLVAGQHARMWPPFSDDSTEELGRVAAMLASVRAIKEIVAQPDGRVRQLLVLDISGRQIKAAVSVGNVDRAGHVAVFVGGLSTTVNGDLRRYDRTMAQITDLGERQLRAGEPGDQGDPGSRKEVAAVTWMGYEAPQWNDTAYPDRSVLFDHSARTGAPLLASFANGIDAAREADEEPQLTIWAHSYGSTTAGTALAGYNTGVDDLAAFGSPGLGVDDLGQLHLLPGHVHVLEATGDVVSWTGHFGSDPGHLAGVDLLSTSAKPLSDGTLGAASSGHSGYLDPGSTSVWNIAAVAAGTPQLLVRRDP